MPPAGALDPLRRLCNGLLPLCPRRVLPWPTMPSRATAAPTAVATRAFAVTPSAQAKTIKPHRLPSNLIPPYPYGERRVYKQSNRGLYGSARIRFGNQVAEKYKNKSRRFWRPNVHVKLLYSPSLGARIKTRLTLRVLRTIRHEGGIDNYLLKSKPARLKELGPGGWNLRWLVMQTKAVQERLNNERRALGVECRPIVDRDDIIQYALDFATPGPLSSRSRHTLDAMRSTFADGFVLGNEALEIVQDIDELSDEAEEALLRQEDGATPTAMMTAEAGRRANV